MSRPANGSAPDPPARLEAAEVVARVRAGEALLVCAYDSAAGWEKFGLAGALPLAALRERLDDLTGPVVLYCRCPADRTAERLAARLRAETGVRACVLEGGFEAAVAAGLRPLRRR
jgi:hypothetical protein